MQLQDFYSVLYNQLTGESRVFSPFRFIIRSLANWHLPFWFKYVSKHKYSKDFNENIIVSLTSFPARIGNLWIVIETILRQTMRPSKITLWLSKNQFESLEKLPSSLLNLQKFGLDIRLVDGDIRSHKKYFYSFQEFAEKMVILIDDDIVYQSTLISDLYKERRRQNVPCIIGSYGYQVVHRGEKLSPYRNWSLLDSTSYDSNLFFGSGGGTLVVPMEFDSQVLDIGTAIELAPYADDVWLNANAIFSNLPIFIVKPRIILSVHNKNNVTLCEKNVGEDMNDIQIQRVTRYFINRHGRKVF